MYPISYEADPALEGRNRLTTFFRYIVAIPWLIVASIYGFVAEIVAVIAWFAIVFTGKYPEGLYNFGGDDATDYPVRVGVPPPLDEYNRLKTGLRLIIGIPVWLLAIVQSIILGVCAVIAWFVILFTGKLPDGLFNPMRSAIAYLTRGTGYFLLLTEDYPPFSYEEGGAAPAGEISSEAASRKK